MAYRAEYRTQKRNEQLIVEACAEYRLGCNDPGSCSLLKRQTVGCSIN